MVEESGCHLGAIEELIRDILLTSDRRSAVSGTAAAAALETVVYRPGALGGWYVLGLAHGLGVLPASLAPLPESQDAVAAHVRGVLQALAARGADRALADVAVTDRRATATALTWGVETWQRQVIDAVTKVDPAWAHYLSSLLR